MSLVPTPEQDAYSRGMRDATSMAQAEIERLKNAIRRHRDERGDDRCYLDDARLYEVLGEGQPDTTLPPRDVFLSNCARFWECRQANPDPVEAERAYRKGGEFEQLKARVTELENQKCRLQATVDQQLEALAHWRREADRDTGRIEKLRQARNRLSHALGGLIDFLEKRGAEGRFHLDLNHVRTELKEAQEM